MTDYNDLKLLNVLYVDDDTELCDSMQKILNLLVRKTFIAHNADEASVLFGSNRIDVAILDVRMGDVNGIELAKKLRQEYKHLPIIIMSSYTDTKDLLAACKLNLIDYLCKPVDLHTIIEVLISALSSIKEEGLLSYALNTEISYNYLSKSLNSNGEEIHLTKNEIVVLELLILEKGKVVSYESIYNVLDIDMTDGALKSLMLRLRKKIGDRCIRNLSKIGYMLL